MSDLETPYEGDAHPAHHARRRSVVRVAICTSLSTLALAVFAGTAAAVPLIVQANPAVQVAGGFSLKGTIYTYGVDTHYHFEYGTTTSYGTSVPVPDADAGMAAVVPVSQTVTGLQPNTTYHYRLAATNSEGPATSSDESFTTPANPNAPPPPSAEPAPSQNQNGSSMGKKVRVKEAQNKGRTILTTASGHTLYSLSVEKNGKFICTQASGCLALWHPLMVPKGVTPTGPVKLGTVKRPEGGSQVTFHGRPLYSFIPDTKPGQAKGEGVKDVGTWHPATVSTKKR